MNEQVREEQIEMNQDKLWNSNRQLGSGQESALVSFSSLRNSSSILNCFFK